MCLRAVPSSLPVSPTGRTTPDLHEDLLADGGMHDDRVAVRQRSDEEQAPLGHGKVAVDVAGDGLAVMRPTFYIVVSYGHKRP